MAIGQREKPPSYLRVNEKGEIIGYIGPEAAKAAAMLSIAHGLKLYANVGMQPNRHWTPTAMLAAASKYTHQKYSRSKRGYLLAHDDLMLMANTIKSNLPIVGLGGM